jgi:hypothetical protein
MLTMPSIFTQVFSPQFAETIYRIAFGKFEKMSARRYFYLETILEIVGNAKCEFAG